MSAYWPKHGAGCTLERLSRDNCEACALSGWGEHYGTGSGQVEPNVAGWGLVYVNAERVIPARYARALLWHLEQRTPHGNALREAVWTHGLRIAGDNA